MSILEFVKALNWSIAILFTLLYLYQGLYLIVGLVCRRHKDRHEPSRLHRFAVVISARNEEQVIGELLESLKQQNYPKELLDLYVVADNCTDDTAGAARKAGAFVYERTDQIHKGKGYAMDYLFHRLVGIQLSLHSRQLLDYVSLFRIYQAQILSRFPDGILCRISCRKSRRHSLHRILKLQLKLFSALLRQLLSFFPKIPERCQRKHNKRPRGIIKAECCNACENPSFQTIPDLFPSAETVNPVVHLTSLLSLLLSAFPSGAVRSFS